MWRILDARLGPQKGACECCPGRATASVRMDIDGEIITIRACQGHHRMAREQPYRLYVQWVNGEGYHNTFPEPRTCVTFFLQALAKAVPYHQSIPRGEHVSQVLQAIAQAAVGAAALKSGGQEELQDYINEAFEGLQHGPAGGDDDDA